MPGKKEDLAYFAGILDGEGCVQASLDPRRRNALSIQVIIANTDRRLIDWLSENFGGSVHTSSRSGIRDLHFWRIPVRKYRTLLEEVRPYLHLKGEQLDVAFELADLTSPYFRGKGRSIPDDNYSQRSALVIQLSEMKKGA